MANAVALFFPLIWRIRAAEAAVAGVAIDVPERTANSPRGTGQVERMLPLYPYVSDYIIPAKKTFDAHPGAATAGLKNMSNVGP